MIGWPSGQSPESAHQSGLVAAPKQWILGPYIESREVFFGAFGSHLGFLVSYRVMLTFDCIRDTEVISD